MKELIIYSRIIYLFKIWMIKLLIYNTEQILSNYINTRIIEIIF